jgi:predicted Mrr-cat superfamily restriction endonuclease
MKEIYPDFTTVAVDFDGGHQSYTYKTVEKLKKGDYVIVNTPGSGFTIAKVASVHGYARYDRDYKWISQKVDHSYYRGVQLLESQYKIKEE